MSVRRTGLALVAVACVLLPHVAAALPADALEGLTVREIRVTGLRYLPPEAVTRHLATRAGEPFHRARLAIDQRRLDELRLFSAVAIRPELDNNAVVVEVAVTETLRLLPTILLRVTDENGVSAGVGARSINLFGGGMQSGVGLLFGGETSVSASAEGTTITPGTWSRRAAFSYTNRRNSIYEFDERSTTAEVRLGRNLDHGLRVGGLASVLSVDTGTSGASLSQDGTDIVPTLGAFVSLDTLGGLSEPHRGP